MKIPLAALQLYEQYASAAQTASVVDRFDWNCGSRCQGDLIGTELVDVLRNNSMDVKGYVALDHKRREILTVFRGSVSLKNWITDLYIDPVKIRQVPFTLNFTLSPKVKVHRGFWLDYCAVRSQVQDTLKELLHLYSDYRFVFVGHSLGGALAVLTALEFYLVKDIFPFVYTYGQPRIGNAAFSDLASQLYIQRVTRQGDIVPLLPPKFLGYSHIEQEYMIQANGETIDCELAKCDYKVKEFNLDIHANGYYNYSQIWLP